MEFRSHKKYYPEDVIVYIEKFNKMAGELIFDFFDSNEHSSFIRNLNLTKSQYGPSMVLVKNYRLRNLQEGTYYAIKSNTLQLWKESENVNLNLEINSYLIGYEIDLSNHFEETEEIFMNSISFNFDSKLYFESRLYKPFKTNFPLPTINGDTSFVVRNVGQGNWNEIKVNDEVNLVFDIGGSFSMKRSEIRTLIDDRINDYSTSKPVLIISHWDFDHYHALLAMDDNEISQFSYIICRDILPNLTTRILGQRLRSIFSTSRIYGVSADYKLIRRGLPRLSKLNSNREQLVLYNSEEHKDRNKSGLALTLKKANSSVLFSGDLHYEQISTDILPDLNFSHKHYLVVPHHGGNAGAFSYSPSKLVKCAEAIISVGKNNYKHPLKVNLQNLKKIFKVRMTILEAKDIEIKLD